ncbi:MAG: hypothetical protein WC770_06295 [Phycisphaerae bacterium]
MNRAQKMALFNLICLAVLLVMSFIFVSWVWASCGESYALKLIAGLTDIWVIIILAILLFSEIWSKKHHAHQISFDERDLLIQTKALHIGFLSLLASFLYMRWLIVPSDGLVVIWLPVLLGVTTYISVFVYSVVILVLYGRSKNHE